MMQATIGQREQWLRCEGSFGAKIACWMHFAWPFARGQWRYTDLLRRTGWKWLRGVPFRSSCGVRVVLDIPSNDFLYLSGHFPAELAEIAFLQRTLRPGDLFVDAGAHRGLYILHVLGRLGQTGRYVAIEPSPANFAFLESAFGDADPRLRRLRIALSDVDGRASLEDDGALTAHLASSGSPGTSVETARLDTLLAHEPIGARQLVVKLDIEGHESRAIRGCSGLAARGVRPIFLVEYLPTIFGQRRADILRAFSETFPDDYRYFGIDRHARRLVELDADGSTTDDVNNMFAVPAAAMERLSPYAP